MILSIMLVGLIIWIILFRFKRRRMYQLASLIRAPKDALPVIGMMHKVSGTTEDIMRTLQQVSYEAMNNKGSIKCWLNHILYYVMVNPVDSEYILKTCMEKDDLHRFIRTLLGNGGIFAPVPIWRRRRKIVIPAFTPKLVENFYSVISEQSDKLVEQLAPQAGTGTFRLWPHINAYTLDSICETAMGVNVSAQTSSNSPFLTSINTVLNIMCKRIFHLWLHPEWLFKLFPEYTEHETHRGVIHTFIDQVIETKRMELQQKQQLRHVIDNNISIESKRKTVLELLMPSSPDEGINNSTERKLNDIELREEMITLTIAATDTSAVAIGFTLKLLSKYPKIQEKVYCEILEVLGKSNRDIERDDLRNLKYLDMVVKEALRLFPPGPFVIRKVETETKLPSGAILPAGSGVVVSIWGAHRDPNYWGPDAECFDPDRFLPERFNLGNTCSYMPFSYGPRNCIGYQYGWLAVKSAVAKIIRNYKIIGEEESSPVPHMRVKLDITLKPVDDFKIALERRQ